MLPSPGQQRAQLVDFGFARDDAFEDIAPISERLDIVELCRLDQRGNNRPAFGPAIRTGEEMVLGAQLDRPDGALDGIRIDLDAPVFEEHTEPLPMAQRISDRLGQVGFRWFLAPSLIGRMVRSTVFESISTRPSLRNTPSPFQWRSAYRIASARLDLDGSWRPA